MIKTGVLIVAVIVYFDRIPQMMPPIIPSPRIGLNEPVMIASGKLSKSPTSKPFVQPGIDKFILKIIKPIANLLINEPVIAFVLSSKP